MKTLIHEIHRRSLWQVLGIYLAGSWIALQVVEILADSIGFPEWVQPFAVVLLVIGFPIVIATAFVQEGMAAGPREAAQTGTRSAETPEVLPEAPVAASAKPAHRKLLTWRYALLGGAAAFALLGIVTAAYLAMRARKSLLVRRSNSVSTVSCGTSRSLISTSAITARRLRSTRT